MRAAGFTLVELLVSLAIVALLIALALPHLPGGLTASEFAGSARELTAALREARSLSLRRNRDIAFTVDRAAGRYGFDGRASDLAAGIGIALSGGENDVVWFFPDGTASEFAGSARELTAALREARSLSLSRNRDVAFTVDRAARRYGFDGRASDLAAGIGIALSGGENDVVWFFPDGTASGGRIVLSRDGARIVIAVEEMTGRVSRVEGP